MTDEEKLETKRRLFEPVADAVARAEAAISFLPMEPDQIHKFDVDFVVSTAVSLIMGKLSELTEKSRDGILEELIEILRKGVPEFAAECQRQGSTLQ